MKKKEKKMQKIEMKDGLKSANEVALVSMMNTKCIYLYHNKKKNRARYGTNDELRTPPEDMVPESGILACADTALRTGALGSGLLGS